MKWNLRPRHDGNNTNPYDNGALDFVRHEVGSQQPATEQTNPKLVRYVRSLIGRRFFITLTVGFCILCELHTPVVASRYCGGHPAISRGVAVAPPVIAPIPEEYERPTSARKRPIPQPLAIFMLLGSIRTSHCLIPVRARNKKTKPSMKTAARAIRYGRDPVPWNPTTWYAKYALRPIPGLESGLVHVPRSLDISNLRECDREVGHEAKKERRQARNRCSRGNEIALSLYELFSCDYRRRLEWCNVPARHRL